MEALVAKLKALFLSLFFLLTLFSIAMGVQCHRTHKTFTIGAKSCTEQHVLREILAILIEKNTDLKVIRRTFEGTTICFHALNTDAIDTYFEYTGTALLDILKKNPVKEPLYSYVKKAFEDKYGITWLDPLGFSNQYVLITRRDTQLKSLSELSAYPHLRIAFDPEFSIRSEAKLLRETYPFRSEPKLMDQVLVYFSLLKGGVDVISGCSTDGRLLDKNFAILTDDDHCLPKYEVAPIIKIKQLQKFPELNKVFSLLKGKITKEEIIRMNYQVEFEGKTVAEVAEEYIQNVILAS